MAVIRQQQTKRCVQRKVRKLAFIIYSHETEGNVNGNVNKGKLTSSPSWCNFPQVFDNIKPV